MCPGTQGALCRVSFVYKLSKGHSSGMKGAGHIPYLYGGRGTCVRVGVGVGEGVWRGSNLSPWIPSIENLLEQGKGRKFMHRIRLSHDLHLVGN